MTELRTAVRTIVATMAVAMVILSPSALAQGNSAVLLTGKDLTQQALVSALAPGPPGSKLAKPQAPRKPPAADVMILFETSSARLTADDKETLEIVGKALNTSDLAPYRFEVQGHADPRGNAAANQRLSERRAAAVRRYLIEAEGVAPKRLKAVGKGAREPRDVQNPAAPENRRVTLVNLTR